VAPPRVAIVGASIAALVAAAALREKGLGVDVLERGQSVGGLFAKVDTPFGTQEVGMHVIYASPDQVAHMQAVLGRDAMDVLEGTAVDQGGSIFDGAPHYNSLYPDVRDHRLRPQIVDELLATTPAASEVADAAAEAERRFGPTAASSVFVPVLEKVWKTSAAALTGAALHCFFDLRRVVAFDKRVADLLKRDPWFDAVVANPDQNQPAGQVFGGRQAVVMKLDGAQLQERVAEWAASNDVMLAFGADVDIAGGDLQVDGGPVGERWDGCLVTSPVFAIPNDRPVRLAEIELTVDYVRLATGTTITFPTYYVLCHDPTVTASRIVNFASYSAQAADNDAGQVLAIETVHAVGDQPLPETITDDLRRIWPDIGIDDAFRLPKTLKLPVPTIENGRQLDAVIASVGERFGDRPLYFTGMRTDRGVFFSHQTIGLAHDAALDCYRQLV